MERPIVGDRPFTIVASARKKRAYFVAASRRVAIRGLAAASAAPAQAAHRQALPLAGAGIRSNSALPKLTLVHQHGDPFALASIAHWFGAPHSGQRLGSDGRAGAGMRPACIRKHGRPARCRREQALE
jgi:hypothetical protein